MTSLSAKPLYLCVSAVLLASLVNAQTHKPRIFADVASVDDEKPNWKEFKSPKQRDAAPNIFQSAEVWSNHGKPTRANFTFTSPSGDWTHYITYHFRADGSLAKLEAQLNTFYGNVSVVRHQYFNSAGTLINSTKKILNLKTRKPTKAREDFLDNPITVYRNTTELPFYTLL